MATQHCVYLRMWVNIFNPSQFYPALGASKTVLRRIGWLNEFKRGDLQEYYRIIIVRFFAKNYKV